MTIMRKGICTMDITGVGFALNMVSSYSSSSSIMSQVSVAMLDKSMELNTQLNTEMIQALEQSVTPHLGGNIDIFI